MRVSVIIPTYNRASLISRAMTSALSDIGDDDEIIIVDDGSTDATIDIVHAQRDSRVRYISQEHSGAGVARNRGTALAAGELVAYLDSDDEWLPGKTALQRELFSVRSDVFFSFTNFIRQCDGVFFRRDIARWHTDCRSWDEIMGPPVPYSAMIHLPSGVKDFPVHIGHIYRGQMHTNYILTSCLMVRRLVADNVIRFATSVRTYEDWECFGRLARSGAGGFLDCETAVQHSHPGPRLTDADYLTRIESRLTILRNVWGEDKDFLALHGEEYDNLIEAQLLLKVRYLLGMGLTQEAYRTTRQLRKVPRGYRLLAAMPQVILKPAAKVRQWTKTTAEGWSAKHSNLKKEGI